MNLHLPLALCVLVVPCSIASAQISHRGSSPRGIVTQTVGFVDTWEGGGGDARTEGRRDVVTRVQEQGPGLRRTTAHLLLLGPWGSHLYSYDEEALLEGLPESTGKRTMSRALDIDGDGAKELVLLERRVSTRIALDEAGRPMDDPGPFFGDHVVSLRYLAREGATLVEHELVPDPKSAPFAALLGLELGGALNAALQLAAADHEFASQEFEKARYRYVVVREWAERELAGPEVAHLSLTTPLPIADPDDAAVLWIAAVRRFQSLPRWYQTH